MKNGVCIRTTDQQNIIADWTKYYIHMDFDKKINFLIYHED